MEFVPACSFHGVLHKTIQLDIDIDEVVIEEHAETMRRLDLRGANWTAGVKAAVAAT